MTDPLSESLRIQSEASSRGFDWPDVRGVLDKIEEELNEIREALDRQDVAHGRRELGDLMLAAVNAARFLDTDPGEELKRATRRFQARFQALDSELVREGKRMESCSLSELDAIWSRVKVRADKALEEGA